MFADPRDRYRVPTDFARGEPTEFFRETRAIRLSPARVETPSREEFIRAN